MGYAEWPGQGMAWQDGLEWYGTVQGRLDLGSGGLDGVGEGGQIRSGHGMQGQCMCMEQHSMEHGSHGMEQSIMERNILQLLTNSVFFIEFTISL